MRNKTILEKIKLESIKSIFIILYNIKKAKNFSQ